MVNKCFRLEQSAFTRTPMMICEGASPILEFLRRQRFHREREAQSQ